MTRWLKFIGIEDVRTIVLEQLLFGSDMDAAAGAEAKRGAGEIAASL